jgi:hypothetical protein
VSLRNKQVINSGTPRWDGRKYEKTVARVKRLDTGLLQTFADNAVTGLGRAYIDLQRHGQVESADEIEDGLLTLWAVTEELRSRFFPGE